MGSDWIECLDKRPADRTGNDLDIIFLRLKDIKAFENFHPMLLQQLCYYGYYECLDQGITLFRNGDVGLNWYVCLSGSVDVFLPSDANSKTQSVACSLGPGTAFGESILYDITRNATIVTSSVCELLRVEQKDFKILWNKNREYMHSVITSLNRLSISDRRASDYDASFISLNLNSISLKWKNDPCRNPALPIVSFPSLRISNSAYVLKSCILSTAPQMIRDRKYHLKMHKSCLVGSEMVDWLTHLSPLVHSRSLAVGMWQALLEEGTIEHVYREHYFKDKYLFYRFTIDEKWFSVSNSERRLWEEQIQDTILLLTQIGPDAYLRMILRKPPQERTANDLDLIFEELIHVKALSHLSSLVKKELASVLLFEAHPLQNTIIFNQGDEATSWYIILKGSVDVSILGKGTVATLSEGDDFGKLSLVNQTPRSATLTTRENNCHFLRVDRDDFNRILKDVEANTIRLKEHGKDVLILEKIPINIKNEDDTTRACYKYSVTLGDPENILEYLLETRILCKIDDVADTFVEDFLTTCIVFFPITKMIPKLLHYYSMLDNDGDQSVENSLNNKRKVVLFLREWCNIAKETFYEDPFLNQFLQELLSMLKIDSKNYPTLKEEQKIIESVVESNPYFETKETKKGKFLWIKGSRDIAEKLRKPLTPKDENIFKVYCADHTYTTLKLTMDTPVCKIIQIAAEKLALNRTTGLTLCEVRSTGERIIFRSNDVSVSTSLSVNGRIFIAPNEHLDALTPLPEQDGPTSGTWQLLEMFGSQEIAYVMTLYDWEYFNTIHPYELICQVFGRHKFNKITSNLDLFMRRFNEIQYWICTELCFCNNIGKRVSLLRKFIKIASYCKEYQNLNSFFAIIMGLSNVAISRLSLTWEKLPNKYKKMFSDYESTMDPTRDHRQYRLMVERLQAPIIPFMPLILKDMTFTHEGNKTFFNNLVNFEKMRLISNTIRTMRHCRSKHLEISVPTNMKYFQEIKEYIQNLKIVDNQRVLTQLSLILEPR